MPAEPTPTAASAVDRDVHALTAARGVRRRDLVRWFAGGAIGLVAGWVAVHAAGGLADAVDALGDLDWRWLVPAFVVEAVSYVVVAERLRTIAGAERVDRVEAFQLGLVLSGFGLLTPASPAEGIAISARHLHRRGMSGRELSFAFTFLEWFGVAVFLATSSVNLIAVAAVERDPWRDMWPFVTGALVVLALLVVAARMAANPASAARLTALVGALRPPGRRRPVEERRAAGAAWHHEAFAFVDAGRRLRALGLTAAALLLDVGCLWFALRAAGTGVGYDVALLSITVSALAVFVPFVPGGIGIAEAAIPAVVHHFGAGYDQGLAAALAYRALGTFLPAIGGAFSIVALRRYEVAPPG